MNYKPIHILMAIFWMLPSFSCKREFRSQGELIAWISDPGNGLVSSRVINDIIITVKYLPPEYLAFRDYQSGQGDSRTYEDILRIYKNSRSFLLTIGPDEEKGAQFDIMKTGIADYEEYKQRFMEMNFDIKNYIVLKTGTGEYEPVLSLMENVYQLSDHKSIYIVFTPPDNSTCLLEAKELDVVFDDRIFNTGINHFNFSSNRMNNIPKPGYIKINKS